MTSTVTTRPQAALRQAAPPPAAAGAAGPRGSPEPSPRPAGGRHLVLGVCCMSLFMTGLDTTIVNAALPSVGRSMHAGVAGLQWTVAAYTVVMAGLLISAGSVADRIGRRTLFQVGLSVFTLGSWLSSLAPSLGWLIGFRVIQGIGGSMLNPSALAIITGTFTAPAERARAIGIWDGVFGLSMAAGPLLGGALVTMCGWRSIFWANIPVGLAAVALTALFVPDSRGQQATAGDPVGQGLVIVMLGALTYAIIEAPAAGWLSARTWCTLAIPAAALSALLAWEPRQPEPVFGLPQLRRRPFSRAILTAVCAIAAIGGFLFLASLYLQDVRDLPPLQAGLALLPMPAAMAACAPLGALIVARHGPRVPLACAGTAIAVSCALLSRCTATTPALYLTAAYALFGGGAGLVQTPVTYGIMSAMPQHQAARASGMNSSGRQVGQCLGVAVAGSVLAGSLHGTFRSFPAASHASWLILAGCGCAVLALALTAAVRDPAARERPADGDTRQAPRARPGPRKRGRHRAPRRAAAPSTLPLHHPPGPPGTPASRGDQYLGSSFAEAGNAEEMEKPLTAADQRLHPIGE